MAATSDPKIFGRNMIANFDRYVTRITKGSREAMRWAAETILEQTMPLVPLDTGALRESGRVETSSGEGLTRHRIGAAVKFGGGPGRVRYAVFVHETNKNYRIGQWKYLQEGVNRARPIITRGVAERLKRVRAT
jgi:hypothetical protein